MQYTRDAISPLQAFFRENSGTRQYWPPTPQFDPVLTREAVARFDPTDPFQETARFFCERFEGAHRRLQQIDIFPSKAPEGLLALAASTHIFSFAASREFSRIMSAYKPKGDALTMREAMSLEGVPDAAGNALHSSEFLPAQVDVTNDLLAYFSHQAGGLSEIERMPEQKDWPREALKTALGAAMYFHFLKTDWDDAVWLNNLVDTKAVPAEMKPVFEDVEKCFSANRLRDEDAGLQQGMKHIAEAGIADDLDYDVLANEVSWNLRQEGVDNVIGVFGTKKISPDLRFRDLFRVYAALCGWTALIARLDIGLERQLTGLWPPKSAIAEIVSKILPDLSEVTVDRALDELTFAGSRHAGLWNRPLIKARSSYLMFFPALYGPNHERFCEFRLRELGWSRSKLGAAFEEVVRSELSDEFRILREKSIRATILPLKRVRVNAVSEEIDCVFRIENTIYVAELKSASPKNDHFEIYEHCQRLYAAGEQVLRKTDHIRGGLSQLSSNQPFFADVTRVVPLIICNQRIASGLKFASVPCVDLVIVRSFFRNAASAFMANKGIVQQLEQYPNLYFTSADDIEAALDRQLDFPFHVKRFYHDLIPHGYPRYDAEQKGVVEYLGHGYRLSPDSHEDWAPEGAIATGLKSGR
jgi:hypothetical protein